MARTDAELEIGLRYRVFNDRPDEDGFDVTLHYDEPQDRGDRREFGDKPLSIDTALLGTLIGDEEEYGRELASQLLKQDAKVEAFFGECCAAAEARGFDLHLRLLLDPRAPARYHAVRWEALRDPRDNDVRVAVRQRVLFSRYLSNADWRAVSPPARGDLRALVAVANPSDLDRYTSFTSNQPLPPVIVEDELARARTALQGLEVETLEAPVTMRRLVSRLDHCSRNGMPIDVLYIVCHGRYVAADDGTSTGDSVLFLERDDGGADRVSGRSLALRIGDLARPPTVAVLCSCQSAGEGAQDTLDAGALSAIGPELAKRGVPAVVAMQGNVSVDGAREFFTEFFRQLHVDGIVDRAVAAGRQAISNTPDWWMPVLFSRLRTGATYYVPGFGDGGEHIWDDIVTAVESGKCTPIVGSGLTDSILGSREAMANRWVRRWQVPVARHAQSDLATVSQYLRVRTSAAHPARELSQYVLSELRQSFADVVDPAVLESRDPDKIISAVGKLRRKENPDDPFAAVARIEAPVYFTTSWTTLLEDALEEAGRPAVSRFFDWNDVDDEENNEDFGKPSLEKPLVFHLFGKFSQPESLVLSEEDYFVWLRAWIDRRSFYTDKGFGKALTRQPLMFLGYRLDDWDFRVLFQGIKSFGGSAQLERNTHVAVQISRDSVVIEPEVVQDYLESYFQADKVHIYWGESTAFLKQLSSKRSLAKV